MGMDKRLIKSTVRKISAALLVLFPLFFVAAAVTAGAAAAETAADNYRVYCTQCHGLGGSGGGINKADMPTNPRDHTSGEMGKLTDDDIYNAIIGGGVAVSKSAFMPPWKGILTKDEIREMVSYLRELCRCKGP